MDQVGFKPWFTTGNALMTLAHPIEVRPKTSAAWLAALRSDQETTHAFQLLQNTAEDKSISSDLYFSNFLSVYPNSEIGQGASSFRLRNFVFSKESSSIENTLNTLRLDEFRDRFTSELLQALRQEPVEPGVIGQADAIITKCLKKNEIATTTWLSELFIDNFDHPMVAADLLLLAGRLSYRVAKPAGIAMAISGLTHKNGAVQEAAIRAFENWATPDCLRILENIQVQPKWLRDYLEDVKRDLKAICDETS